MAILAFPETALICQGLTGKQATIHAKAMLACGTNLVGGVVPRKGGSRHENLPIFETVKEARQATNATASIIFVPPPFAADAILEAALAGINLIIAITEGIPILDMMRVKSALQSLNPQPILIGPNCPGIMTPPSCKMGILPEAIFSKGDIGVVSRSGTLTYEAVSQLTAMGLGQSSCVGIGGDPIHGLNFTQAIELFFADSDTKGIFMVGEIGGSAEEEAAHYLKKHGLKKPIAAFIAGQTAPKGRRMGHAGAIVSGEQGTAHHKIKQLQEAGVQVASSAAEMGETMKRALDAAAS